MIGLPVWEAVFTVRLQDDPMRVTGSESSLHPDVDVAPPPKSARFLPGRRAVETALRRLAKGGGCDLLFITDQRLVIYRFDPAQRFDPEARPAAPVPPRPVGLAGSASELGPVAGSPSDSTDRGRPPFLEGAIPTLPLPPVPESIEPGDHFVCNEVLFTLAIGPWPNLHWRALLEVRSGAVLYLRALVTSAFGNVFAADPITLTGDTTITPCSPASTLDPLTTVVTLPGLTPPSTPGAAQLLAGEFLALGELSTPTVAAPTAALPAGNFSFSAPTDDFGAVSTYFATDRAFRLMHDALGIDVSTYFVDSAFPVTVGHRDSSLGVVNARGYGSETGSAGGMGLRARDRLRPPGRSSRVLPRAAVGERREPQLRLRPQRRRLAGRHPP